MPEAAIGASDDEPRRRDEAVDHQVVKGLGWPATTPASPGDAAGRFRVARDRPRWPCIRCRFVTMLFQAARYELSVMNSYVGSDPVVRAAPAPMAL